jgi:hypothetical protein
VKIATYKPCGLRPPVKAEILIIEVSIIIVAHLEYSRHMLMAGWSCYSLCHLANMIYI